MLGIDEVPGYIRQAQFAAEVLGLEIDYQRMNIYDLSRSGMKFDIVLALGVIYHCKHPLLAAENIAAVCDGMAIVESHVVKSPGLFRRNEPIWSYVYDGYKDAASNRDKKEGDYNWWFPNMEGLISLFRTVGFSKVETIHEETRGSIACHK